ncbi:MAG TPA: Asp-tRNA(Asn)/Glu-tRNA(Gln) amidotransferase subunit GatA, partial [Pyrodictium sp.]|nr:Asp-tRNA(Asn)/Glu-tRNA(Gln) amidotransferase subunit GatA [Pyrodictium sp.]
MRVFEVPGWRLVEMLVGGDIDASDYVATVFERIEKVEEKINAYITVREREAVEREVKERVELARRGRRLPLAGLLVA